MKKRKELERLARMAPLRMGIHDSTAYIELCELITVGSQILAAETKDELESVLNASFFFSHFAISIDFEEIRDVKTIKERIIYHVVGKRFLELYRKEKTVRGPKGDKIRRFFDDLTTEPQDIYDAAELYELRDSIFKNHRRFDPFPERGKTKIKDDMIYRQPV